MAEVSYDKASLTYPNPDRLAVDQLLLQIGDGEFLVLVRPSGRRMSTSLRIAPGREPVERPRVLNEEV